MFLSFAFVHCWINLVPKNLRRGMLEQERTGEKIADYCWFSTGSPFSLLCSLPGLPSEPDCRARLSAAGTAASIWGSFGKQRLLICQLLFLFICAYCVCQGTGKGRVTQRAAWGLVGTKSACSDQIWKHVSDSSARIQEQHDPFPPLWPPLLNTSVQPAIVTLSAEDWLRQGLEAAF